MPFFFRKAACCLLLCLAASTAAGQFLPTQPGAPAAAPTTPAAHDPLGRDTPSGAVFGFLQTAQAGNYSTADQYLQMPPAKRLLQGEELAAKLKAVMDRAYSGDLRRISTQPSGTPQEGVPLDHQLIGLLSTGDVEADLVLVHVSDASGARIWLFSSETLAKIPDLYEQLEARQVETRLPQLLVQHHFLGMPWWQWFSIFLAVPLAAGLGWLALQILRLPWSIWMRYRKTPPHPDFWLAVRNPLWLVLGISVHRILVTYIRIPLLHRHYYQLLVGVVFVSAFIWLMWRILEQIMARLRKRAINRGQTSLGTLMLLGERILKMVVFIVAIFAVLRVLGFNLTTVLAGVGIGGVAIAFAAQKTLENLFAGVSILGDEVIRVGDLCRVGDRLGTVEDISLRSTRIRTSERTEIAIPNGSLATMNVENLSRRDKILFNTKLGLRCETSADQLRYVLAQIRKLLYEHPRVETDGARIRLVGLDESSLTLEIFCYILTRDGAEFLAIREDLLLHIMDIVAASGTSLAFPSRTLYLTRDHGLDAEKTASVAREVQQWREEGKLPFPDQPSDEIAQISNSLPYPPPESALSQKDR